MDRSGKPLPVANRSGKATFGRQAVGAAMIGIPKMAGAVIGAAFGHASVDACASGSRGAIRLDVQTHVRKVNLAKTYLYLSCGT